MACFTACAACMPHCPLHSMLHGRFHNVLHNVLHGPLHSLLHSPLHNLLHGPHNPLTARYSPPSAAATRAPRRKTASAHRACGPTPETPREWARLRAAALLRSPAASTS